MHGLKLADENLIHGYIGKIKQVKYIMVFNDDRCVFIFYNFTHSVFTNFKLTL